MPWLRPSPPDDRNPHGGTDDDAAHITPFRRPRVIGAPYGGAPQAPYFPSNAVLDGPHFRIGYQFYNGISYQSNAQGEADSVIGMPFRMRPPLIPRRSAGVMAVRNAMIWVQTQPSYSSEPIIMPRVTRR